MTIVLFVDFMVSMSHFDTGTPPDEQARLNVAIWVVAVGGAVLGARAARRVRRCSPPVAD